VTTQYLRRATLLIGDDETGIDMSDLQFSFSVRQADLRTPQYTNIRIYNVARSTAEKIKANEYTRVVLQAGYQGGNFGLIFDGQMIQARLGRESAVDSYLDVLAAEGYEANQAVVNTTLAAGATEQDVANAAGAAMGQSIHFNNYNPTVRLPRGRVLYGMARTALRKAAATAGYGYFYDRGGISWVPLQGYKDGAAVVLNAATGMIGWPEQTQEGVKVRCLLNPLLSVGALLQIDNASIQRAQPAPDINYLKNLGKIPSVDADGLYRIYVIEHSGDTRAQAWYSDIICLTVDRVEAGKSSLVQKGQF